jgi:hypothetical protein
MYQTAAYTDTAPTAVTMPNKNSKNVVNEEDRQTDRHSKNRESSQITSTFGLNYTFNSSDQAPC